MPISFCGVLEYIITQVKRDEIKDRISNFRNKNEMRFLNQKTVCRDLEQYIKLFKQDHEEEKKEKKKEDDVISEESSVADSVKSITKSIMKMGNTSTGATGGLGGMLRKLTRSNSIGKIEMQKAMGIK